MVFCPLARGPCQGRTTCRLWIRGRLLNTDSKLLAAELARFNLNHESSVNQKTLVPELIEMFWQIQGIPNIRREVLIDRYLRAKVKEVEEIAAQWLTSPGFHKVLLVEKQAKAKEAAVPHTQHCKSPP